MRHVTGSRSKSLESGNNCDLELATCICEHVSQGDGRGLHSNLVTAYEALEGCSRGPVAAVHAGGCLPQVPHIFDVFCLVLSLVSWRAAKNLGASKHFWGPHCIFMERTLVLVCFPC